MTTYLDEYPDSLIKDLLWTRNYHKAVIEEIDRKLMELCKRYERSIQLD
jgi:hypothetical protein